MKFPSGVLSVLSVSTTDPFRRVPGASRAYLALRKLYTQKLNMARSHTIALGVGLCYTIAQGRLQFRWIVNLETNMFRTRGRAVKPLTVEFVRELEPNDMVLLETEKGVKPNPIRQLRDRHHALARKLAEGATPGEAAIWCGYSVSRVSILQSDPAFKELLEFYRREVNIQYRDLNGQLASIAMDATSELLDRLETEPEKISTNQLMELTKLGADRTGYGPQSSSTNLNVNVDLADRMKAARQRVEARKLDLKVIEGGTP